MDPESEQDLMGAPTPEHEVVAEAVASTAEAYGRDVGTDVVRHLRDVLAVRGLRTADHAWLEETARRIRSGHAIDLDDPRGPGLPSFEGGGTAGNRSGPWSG